MEDKFNIMEHYKFIIKTENNAFVSIIKVIDNETTGANVNLYSTFISDEETARESFTLTGLLPSQKFEELMSEAKEEL